MTASLKKVGLRFSSHTGIHAMQVIKVRRETESLNRPFDVLLNMGRRVGDTSTSPKDVEAAL